MQLGMQLGLYWNSRLYLFGELDAVSHTLRLTPLDNTNTSAATEQPFMQDMCVVTYVKYYTLIFIYPIIISALDSYKHYKSTTRFKRAREAKVIRLIPHTLLRLGQQ